MPGRSPHRRSTPPPPLISSRHSPSRRRVRSPDRVHPDMSDRNRDRRDFRPARRSPTPPQARAFTPPIKRKVSPSKEKDMRRTKLSRSPVSLRGGSEHRSYVPKEPDTHHFVRTVSDTSSRFVDKEMEEEERAVPQFRGPEGTLDFSIHDLKKFTIEIIRKPSSTNEDLTRSIINPDNIVPVRRPDEGSKPLFTRLDVPPVSSKDRSLPPEEYRRVINISSDRGGSNERERSRERAKYSSGPYDDSRHHPQQYYREREPSPYARRHSPPREEFFDNRQRLSERAGSSRDEYRGEESRRIVERKRSFDRQSYERESDLRARINEKREPLSRSDDREHLSKRYEMERERPGPSHEMDRESLGRRNPVSSVRGHEMERKRPTRSQEREREPPTRSHEMERERPRPSHEMERERSGRSNEMQRSRPGRPREYEKEHPVRGHDVERERPSRSHEMSRERPRPRSHERERERPSRSHHSPPPSSRDRRRPGSSERSRERGRGEDWEREGGGERRRRHSRERSDRPRDRSEHYEEKRHKAEDGKKEYKSYEEEFTPSNRGRGGMSMRRGMPPGLRGRGMVRGMPRFPRGGMMIPRGLPRPPPFMAVPRFPPRFFPPY